jgi:hypothetical protein
MKMDDPKQNKGGGYGKRPLWQWVVIYVVVAAVAYFLVYYYFFKPKSDSGSSSLYGGVTQVQLR